MTAIPPRPQSRDHFVKWYPWVNSIIQVILVVVVVILAIQNSYLQNQNSQRIKGQHDSQIQQCELANTTREQDAAIWNRLLSISTPRSASPEAKAIVADLRRLVDIKDTPRDCAAAYPG